MLRYAHFLMTYFLHGVLMLLISRILYLQGAAKRLNPGVGFKILFFELAEIHVGFRLLDELLGDWLLAIFLLQLFLTFKVGYIFLLLGFLARLLDWDHFLVVFVARLYDSNYGFLKIVQEVIICPDVEPLKSLIILFLQIKLFEQPLLFHSD